MPPTQYFLGIDLHKTMLQVCVLDEEGETVHTERCRIDTLTAGLEAVAMLAQWQPARIAVEALGLNRWFVNACRRAGYDVIVVDPRFLNLRAKGKKTDRRDAYEIARALRMGDLDRCAQTYYPSDDEYGVRQLFRIRHDLVQQRTHLANRIGALLDAYKHPRPRGRLYSGSSLAYLKRVHLATPDHELCLQELAHLLEQVQASIRRLEARIDDRALEPKVAALRTMVPHFGALSALSVVYELGDVHRFRNARAVASYAGLAARVHNSADKQHHGRITKRGNAELRWILNQCAVRLLATTSAAIDWAEPRLRRMHKNKVRTTLARRLLVGIYKTLKTGEVFKLDRCLGIA